MKTPPGKPSRLFRFLRWSLFIVVVLVTMGALFVAEEDLRGSQAWSRYKRQMEAKGESFDATRLIPPRVADDQNLAMIAFFTNAEVVRLPEKGAPPRRTEWRYGWALDLTNWAAAYGKPSVNVAEAASNVLESLNQQEPLLVEVESAKDRPSFWFDISYEDWFQNTNAMETTMKKLGQTKSFFRVLALHAEAELARGQPDGALTDIQVMLRAEKGLREEPLFIQQLVAYAVCEVLLQPVAEGLSQHRWTDAQLRVLQEELQNIDFVASTVRSLQGERDLCLNAYLTGLGLKPMPRGWQRLEQLNFNRAFEDNLLPCFNVSARRIDPTASRACDGAIERLKNHAGWRHTFMAANTLPSLAHACIKTAQTQTDVDEVAIACGLERFRLVEGHYPDALEALVPRFAGALPHDVITGQPFKYRRNGDGTFILYSLGWSATDHGGKPDDNWVFAYPTPESIQAEAVRGEERRERSKMRSQQMSPRLSPGEK